MHCENNNKATTSKKTILKLISVNGKHSISELSKELDLSVPTATKLIAELVEEGFIRDLGKIGTSGGRRPSIFGLNSSAGYFIGVDIARQHFHISIADFSGVIIRYFQDLEFVLEANAESFKNLASIVKSKVIDSGISWRKVLGVGVSLSGRVNPEEGFSLSFFSNERFPLKSLFEKEFEVPVSIENDSRAMTYGEYLAGGRKDGKSMLFINISWGLGMGMIMNGRLYYGKSGYSGEIGHFPMLDNNRICRCGKTGCLETGASGYALCAIMTEKMAEGRPSILSEKFRSNEQITLDDILDAIDKGDVLAIESMGEVGATLGRTIAGLMNIFNPGLVIIGGRLIVGNDYLMLPVRTAVNKYSMHRVSVDTDIHFSSLGRKAASIGDCLIARDNYLGIL